MTDYIDSGDFKTRHGITVATDDTRIAAHCTAASLEVDTYCRRQFGQHSGAATARYFYVNDPCLAEIDDCYEITAVEVDLRDDGTYSESWTVTTDYLTEPTNGTGPNGQTGWPITHLRAVDAKRFRTGRRRPSLKVTAKWGWATTPTDVIEATYLMAHRLYYEVKVPGGVTAPNVDFGLPGQTLAPQYTANRLLDPYRRGRGLALVR